MVCQPVIFLMGATATGKTTLSVKLAHALDAEIISVDSALVYRCMDIGTAKPSLRERAGIAHHLIDICDPWHAYSAARFCDDAKILIQQIRQRGKRVLMVGGTMLYFKALEQGLAPLPEADDAVRATLVEQAEKEGWQALHQELQRLDPVAASRIHPNDPQRLQRALEVYRLTGTPMTDLLAQTQSSLTEPAIKFALVPNRRQWLHDRIELRFRQMVEQGFLDEVRKLYAHPLLHAAMPSMRSIGYRQAWEFLQIQESAQADPMNWVDKSIVATRQLAKRQLTWVRGMDNVNMIECDTLSIQEQQEFIGGFIE